MKEPEVGELWLDERAWATSGKPRLLLVTGQREDSTIEATAIQGGNPGPGGIALRYFHDDMSWQGFWSLKHSTLPRMTSPFAGNALETIAKSSNAAKMSGHTDIANAIIPSFQPDDVEAYDAHRQRVTGVRLTQRTSSLHAGIAYLCLSYGARINMGASLHNPDGLRELWYQRQQNAWHLVRTLAVVVKRAH